MFPNLGRPVTAEVRFLFCALNKVRGWMSGVAMGYELNWLGAGEMTAAHDGKEPAI